MSRWSLAIKKQLSPAKKAWKSFITKAQPHLQKLVKTSLPKAVKAAAHRLLISLRSILPSRLRPISTARRSYYNYDRQYHYHNHNKNMPLYKSFAAIHIDELFEPVAAATTTTTTAYSASTTSNTIATRNKNILRDNMHADAGTSAGNIIKKGKGVAEDHVRERDLQKSKSIYSVEDAWNAVVAASPQLRCVDERAEEFIYKVRQDMKLQKEKSLLDFEEM